MVLYLVPTNSVANTKHGMKEPTPPMEVINLKTIYIAQFVDNAANVDPNDIHNMQSPKANLRPIASEIHPKKRDPNSMPVTRK